MSAENAVDKLIGHFLGWRLPLRIALAAAFTIAAYQRFGTQLAAFSETMKVPGIWVFVAVVVGALGLGSLAIFVGTDVAERIAAGVTGATRTAMGGWQRRRERKRVLVDVAAALDGDEKEFLALFYDDLHERWMDSGEPLPNRIYRGGERLVARGLLVRTFDLNDRARPVFIMTRELLATMSADFLRQHTVRDAVVVPTNRVLGTGGSGGGALP